MEKFIHVTYKGNSKNLSEIHNNINFKKPHVLTCHKEKIRRMIQLYINKQTSLYVKQ